MPEIVAAFPGLPASICFSEAESKNFNHLILISFSLRARERTKGARLTPILQWDDQQGVDLLAVEDDEALDEAIGPARHVDAIEIAASGEEAHLAVVHDAHGDEVRVRLGYRRVDLLDADRADDMTVAVGLENVGAPECGDPVDQHAARGGIDDAMP